MVQQRAEDGLDGALPHPPQGLSPAALLALPRALTRADRPRRRWCAWGVCTSPSRCNLLEIVLFFGLAAQRCLVTKELPTEAHEETETPLLTLSFFLGFLLFLLLGMLA